MPGVSSHLVPTLLPIERPLCAKCEGRMLLAGIESRPAHCDLRTFECPKCDHVLKVLVEDPLKSAGKGWLAGGLKPPE